MSTRQKEKPTASKAGGTKRKKRKGRASDGPPTRLQLPSGQDIIVELEYPEDLTIDWRTQGGSSKKPLKVRGTRLKIQFPGGEELTATAKCAPEDPFDKYAGKREVFRAICEQDNQRATQGIPDEDIKRLTAVQNYLDRTLRKIGFDGVADEIGNLLFTKLESIDNRDSRSLLLPPEDRTALMKYLCPRFQQRRRKKGEPEVPIPTFKIIKEPASKVS